MMSKGRTLKDLSQIGNLFGPKVAEQPFAVQLAEAFARPAPVMDISDAIIDLMKNYRGWTVGDVSRCLATHPDSYLIPTLMNKFATEGKFEIMQITGNANTYTLKKERTMISLAPQKAFVLREEQGVRKAPDERAVIRVEEGMDVSIWKVMSDFKPRTAKDIRAILVEYKFDARQLDRRIDSLIRSNRWFEREHKRSGTVYTLKKGTAMPAIPNTPLNNANQSELAKLRTNLTVTHNEPETTETMMPAAQAIPAIDAVIATAKADYVIQPDDSLPVAIWKAMSDHQPYRSADVFVLLQSVQPGVKEQSVYARLSAMYARDMLIRVEDPAANGRGYIYTLKEDVAMPTGRKPVFVPVPRGPMKPKTAASAAPAVQEQAVQSQPAAIQEEIPMTKPALVQVNNTPVEKVELLDLTVGIKGERFTIAECRQLVDELKKLNYGTGAARAQNSLIERTITIKGIQFSEAELDQIVKGLVAEGLTNIVSTQHRR